METYSFERLSGKDQLSRLTELGTEKPLSDQPQTDGYRILIESAFDGSKCLGIVKDKGKYLIYECVENVYSNDIKKYKYFGGPNDKNKYTFTSFQRARKSLLEQFAERNKITIFDANSSKAQEINPMKILSENFTPSENVGNELDVDKMLNRMRQLKEQAQNLPLPSKENEPTIPQEVAPKAPSTSVELQPNTDEVETLLEDDPVKEIQSLTGKLTQIMRENLQEIPLEMQISTFKSVMSAIDIGSEDLEKRRQIAKEILKATPKNSNQATPPAPVANPVIPEVAPKIKESIQETVKAYKNKSVLFESNLNALKELLNDKSGKVSSKELFS